MLEQKQNPQHGRTPVASIEKTSIAALKASLQGELLQPGDDTYDSARRVWNGMIDRKPGIIVRCTDVEDVSNAVNFARNHRLLVSVRGGGHSMTGSSVCDGGIVIDLSLMKGIQVDPVTRTARAGAGLMLGEFVRETQKFGLGTTVGTVSTTGLSGLTLGGGMGWLMGKHGLAVDNLLAVDLVTADGVAQRASASQHSDLFWGMRGGSGNLGIATSFTFRLHPVGALLAGMAVYPMTQAREALHFYREFSRTAPDELTAYAVLATMPEGQPVIMIALCYCGESLEEGERIIAPVRKFGPPIADLIRPMSYLDLTTMIDATSPAGRHYYEKSSTLKELSDEVIERIAHYGSIVTSPLTLTLVQHVHGAVCRVAPTDTAVSALRDESYVISIVSVWEHDEASRHIEWTRAFWRALKPYASSGVYINYLTDETEERIRASYGVNYERLLSLKNTYDPTNLFRMNQNIKPTR